MTPTITHNEKMRRAKAYPLLVEALRRATNMRPALLMTHGAVPEAVLEYCNETRALLRSLGEEA